jgi:hypothetical protein
VTTYYDLPPLDTESIARIWWESASEFRVSWNQIANWCHGAYTVSVTSDDREAWNLLGLIAWDHAGAYLPELDEVAA